MLLELFASVVERVRGSPRRADSEVHSDLDRPDRCIENLNCCNQHALQSDRLVHNFRSSTDPDPGAGRREGNVRLASSLHETSQYVAEPSRLEADASPKMLAGKTVTQSSSFFNHANDFAVKNTNRPEADAGPEILIGKTTTRPPGFFSHANNFVIKDATVTENIAYNFDSGTTVLQYLLPYTSPDAATDSGTRHPPPRCHPGTRCRIRANLEAWLADERRQWKMLWLYGPAGVGKSAVAQSFAEYCIERGRLGAAFFFSRLDNDRAKPRRVVPTLVYQLAVQCEEYRKLVTRQLTNNPSILDAAAYVQFRKLIVDPFSNYQSRDPSAAVHPYLVILDGLDECQGEDAQCEIVEMIGEHVRLKKDFPLLWLICSRPEPHLRYTFSKADFTITCGREILLIDNETREEVDRYLRDGFEDIRTKFPYHVDESWPSQNQIFGVSTAASGLFIIAATVLKYVGDLKYANPPVRLDAVLSFTRSSHDAGATSPLETLDLLYTRILSDIPEDVFPITKRILFHAVYIPILEDMFQPWSMSAQTLCNFLCLEKSTFYSALQKLHSVIDIPLPDAAATTPLRFFHASFGDYLRDPARSRKFTLRKPRAFVEIAKSCLYWHEVDSTTYHIDEGRRPMLYRLHDHATLPNLKWVTDSTAEEITQNIVALVDRQCWTIFSHISNEKDQDLLFRLHQFDFRYIEYIPKEFLEFVNWLHQQVADDSCNNVVRTEPCDPVDKRLLSYLKLLTGTESVEAATLPLDLTNGSGYFIIGYGVRASIFYLHRQRDWGFTSVRLDLVNGDKPPSHSQTSEYRSWVAWVEQLGRWESIPPDR